jgi:hypothetical protein
MPVWRRSQWAISRQRSPVLTRKHSPAWRLLCADNAPLVLSFLHRVFVDGNARSVAATELTSQLDGELYALNERLGEGTFPKRAQDYLADWSRPEAGWLRTIRPPRRRRTSTPPRRWRRH